MESLLLFYTSKVLLWWHKVTPTEVIYEMMIWTLD